MVKTSNVALMVLIAFIVGFVMGAVAIRKYRPIVSLPVVTIQRDTVIIRDTIAGHIPEPRKVEVIRHDTVMLQLNPEEGTVTPIDTVDADSMRKANDEPRKGQDGEMIIPISSKVYETSDYRAVVSGWRPSLDSMQLYRQTVTVTNTVTRLKVPRWAVTLGGGVGYTGQQVQPIVGISVGFVLWSN